MVSVRSQLKLTLDTMSNPYIKKAKQFGAPYELGITRLSVLKRDGWLCRMERCHFEDRTIDPTVRRVGNGVIPDEFGSVDHIVPLSEPGTPGHVGDNVRASHRLCNREAFSPSKKKASPTTSRRSKP